MEVLLIGSDLPLYQIAHKLIYFGVDGINVFQGTRTNVTKQLHENYVPNSLGVHCMAHHTNFVKFTFGHPLSKSITNVS
jgi:hypothetical protein